MRMRISISAARRLLVTTWFSFLFLNACLVLYLYFGGWIEKDNFKAALEQLNTSYAPYVGAITLYYWAGTRNGGRPAGRPGIAFTLAWLCSFAWNALLLAFFLPLLFQMGAIEDSIENIHDIGAMFSWLVAGAMGYYFAKPTSSTNPIRVRRGHAVNRMASLIISFFVLTAAMNICFSQGHKYALVIGVAGYPKFGGNDPLHYADDDAKLFYDFITTDKGGKFSPENIKILLNQNATRDNILEAIHWVSQRAESNDLVYIYFSGHGLVDDKGVAYFMPYDADFQRPGIRGLRTNYFVDRLQSDISPRQLVLFVDACHSGAAYSFDGVAKDGVSNITYNFNEAWKSAYSKQNAVRMAILSASSNQRSYEDQHLKHGIFTWYLVRGMNGAADSTGIGDGNGYVTAGELYRYVLDKVEYHAKYILNDREQSPTKSPEFASSFPLAVTAAIGRSAVERSEDFRNLGQELVKRSELAVVHYSNGYDLLSKGDVDQAAAEFRHVLEIDSTIEAAYVNLGYIQQGRFDIRGAIRYYQKALELDPNEYVAHNNLGFSYLILLDFEKSIDHLRKSYWRFPTLLTALNLGDAYRYSGRFDMALKWHQSSLRAMENIKDYMKDYYAGGTWLYNYMPLYRGDVVTIGSYVQVKTKNEKLAFVHFSLSFDYALKKMFDNAQEEFEKASALVQDEKLRFFFANKIQAVQKLLNLDETVNSWFERHMKQLLSG